MTDIFKFPHTPHLAWLGEGIPRDDKVLPPSEVNALLTGVVVVEEKIDGANLGISINYDGDLRVQNRGHYLDQPYTGQFEKLNAWLAPRVEALFEALIDDLIIFGEWSAARHSLDYDRLPDWYLVFDVYDRKARRFWSTVRRNALAERIGLTTVPNVLQGHISLVELKRLLQSHPSAYRSGPMEGIVVRRERGDWLEDRAKLVRPDFTQAIGEHWSRRGIQWNHLDWGARQKLAELNNNEHLGTRPDRESRL